MVVGHKEDLRLTFVKASSVGVSTARASGLATDAFHELAVYVLNYGLRPVLAKWHPLLADH